MAVTLDGKIATSTGDSRWVTGVDARQYVHRLRSEVDAVMVGINTVLKDDPQLTVRDQGAVKRPVKTSPHRVILDSLAQMPLNARVISEINPDSKTIIAVSSQANPSRIQALKDKGADILFVPEASTSGHTNTPFLDLKILMNELGEMGISYLMVEGGASVNASMLKADLVDKVFCFVAPKIVGGQSAVSAIGGESPEKMADALELKEVKVEPVGSDILIRGYLHRCRV